MADGVSRKRTVRSNCLVFDGAIESKRLNHFIVLTLFFVFDSSDPDLWINPDDSFILELNAGEIVVSDTFSAGITLRFPRITKIRNDKP